MIAPRLSVLLVASALAGGVVGVPGAGAGSGGVQAIRTAAANYKLAALNGSPKACQMLTATGNEQLLAFASMDTGRKIASCPEAIMAEAKFDVSKCPSPQVYVHTGELKLKAIARGKVKIDGSRAKLSYTVVDRGAESFLSYDLALMHGRWLIDGYSDSYG